MRYFMALVLVLTLIFSSALSEQIYAVSRNEAVAFYNVELVLDKCEMILGYRPDYQIFEQDRVCTVVLLNNCFLELPIVYDEAFGRILVAGDIPGEILESNSLLGKFSNGGTLEELKEKVAEKTTVYGYVVIGKTLTIQCFSKTDQKEFEYETSSFDEDEGTIYLSPESFRQTYYYLYF